MRRAGGPGCALWRARAGRVCFENPPLPRPAPPPDFRYVGLSPAQGRASPHLAFAAAGVSSGLAGLLLFYGGPEAPALVMSLVAGGITAVALSEHGAFRAVKRPSASPMAMAIVPWGVLIQPDGAEGARVLRWPGVRSVSVDFVHTRDAAGTPSTSWSFVTIETGRERFVGRTAGPVALERLMAHLGAYAQESSLPVALDLEGTESGPIVGMEPVIAPMLGRVRDLLRSGAVFEALSLEGGSYRGDYARGAGEATVAALREALRTTTAAADPRVIAALLAAELGASALVPDLLRLVTAAHPGVAAAAKAAALRLGAEPNRAGSLDEVAPFLLDEDLASLEAWIAESRPRPCPPGSVII